MLALAALAASGLLGACGGTSPSASGRRGGAASTTGTTVRATTTAATTTSTTTTSTTRGAATTTTRVAGRRAATTTSGPGPQAGARQGALPAGGPAPSGFQPVSFTAVSPSEYWLLGTAPCSNPVCTSVLRTTDGGTGFVGLPAPPVPLASGFGNSSGIDTLRFADPLDGYAFAPGGGQFWDTHDGGEHWAEPAFMAGRSLLAFGTGAGYAFALVGTCQGGTCSAVSLQRSAVGADNWTALDVPVPSGVSGLAAMTVHGSDLWISLTTSATQANQLLVIGSASGASFTTAQSPCYAGLGGSLAAASSEVVWAVCPTGMLAGAYRSSDGGRSWTSLGQATGELPNSALLAAASATTAVLSPGSSGGMLRTTDGGATWSPVPSPAGSGNWAWAGFTSATVGAALRSSGGTSQAEQLYRTTDGGATWTGPVALP